MPNVAIQIVASSNRIKYPCQYRYYEEKDKQSRYESIEQGDFVGHG
ncbi:Uncharacterised protein [Burkholderia cenocepacia]|nr:Uncharacterised protein [Burkholderia cenocepacia]